eukprot:gene3558-6293_t
MSIKKNQNQFSYSKFEDVYLESEPRMSINAQNNNFLKPLPVNPMSKQSNWVKPIAVEPVLVFICNIFAPGLGHILLGQHKKGIMLLTIYGIMSIIIWPLTCFLVGIPLLIIPLVHIILILYDGQILADRAKRGIPIMEGECGTSLIKPFLSLVCNPVFNNSDLEDCPRDWMKKMQNIEHQ